jgi:hypothetical protein
MGNHVQMAVPGVTQGQQFTVTVPVCLDEAGSVTITDVEPADGGTDLTIRDFAVRSVDSKTNTITAGGLASAGLSKAERSVRVVDSVCRTKDRQAVGLQGEAPDGASGVRAELVVTVSPVDALGSSTGPDVLTNQANGLRISYTSGNGQHVATSSLGVTLCSHPLGDNCPPPAA